MILIFYFIFYCLISLSSSWSKFILLKHNHKNAIFCKALLQTTEDIEQILNEKPFSYQINATKHMCYLKCLYQTSGLINKYGNAELNNVIPVINNLLRFSLELKNLSEINRNTSAINVVLMCQNDEQLICRRSILIIECLKTVINLNNFGYLHDDISSEELNRKELKEIFKKAIVRFQTFFNLKVTGTLSLEVLKLLHSPRCTSKDFEFKTHRFKRFSLAEGSRWRKLQLTYKILSYPENIPKKLVDKEIDRAFHDWTEPTLMKVKRKRSGVTDIEIEFVKDEHGDESPFDGPGGLLAHTFYPLEYFHQQKSFIHFDASENWTVNSVDPRGLDVYQVALHEIGHSLGLQHSNIPGTVMWPYIHKGYQPYFVLTNDDINGVQMLYGSNSPDFIYWLRRVQYMIINFFN